MIEVERDAVLRFRARATHVATRLPADALTAAAWGGLQDSAPRSGVLSLRARLADLTPAAWEHDDLAQVWGPRHAVYIVPAGDAAVFTLGRMPREAAQRTDIEQLSARIHSVLGDHGGRARTGVVASALGFEHVGGVLRYAAIAGTLLLRWNASTTELIAVGEPSIDVDSARVELARRFVRWLAPQTPKRFATWAGVREQDANATWRSLEPELVPVVLGSRTRWVHELDLDALVGGGAEPVGAVRLLPAGDPYLHGDRQLLVSNAARYEAVWGNADRAIPGAMFVDGELRGVW